MTFLAWETPFAGFIPSIPKASGLFLKRLSGGDPESLRVFRAGPSGTPTEFCGPRVHAHYFVNQLGQVSTIRFVSEGYYYTDYYAFLTQTPTLFHLQSLEPTTLLTASYTHIQQCYGRYLVWPLPNDFSRNTTNAFSAFNWILPSNATANLWKTIPLFSIASHSPISRPVWASNGSR